MQVLAALVLGSKCTHFDDFEMGLQPPEKQEMRGSGVSQPKAQSAGLMDKMSISASGLGEPQQAIFHGQ